MPTINVHTPFLLTLPGGISHQFAVGVHEVEAHVAAHWYTLEHAVVEKAEAILTAAEEEAQALTADAALAARAVAEVAKEAVEKVKPKRQKKAKPAVEPTANPAAEPATE